MVWIWLSFGYGLAGSRVAGVVYFWLVLWRSPVLVFRVSLSPGGELALVNC